MRYMLLSIIFLLAAQPLQASFCDMCADKSSSHQSMSDGDMHANMAHDIDDGSDNQSMDCCDDEPVTGESGCSSMAHCGACPAGLVAVNPVVFSAWLSPSASQVSALSQVPPNQFSSPPFRPPIS